MTEIQLLLLILIGLVVGWMLGKVAFYGCLSLWDMWKEHKQRRRL